MKGICLFITLVLLPMNAADAFAPELQQSRSPFTPDSRWNMCGPPPCDKTFQVTVAKRTGDTITFQMPFGTLDVAESVIEILNGERRVIRIKEGLKENARTPSSTGVAVGALLGSWSWSQDKALFSASGTGVYEREGKTCYDFKYTLTGNTLTMTADRKHECGGEMVSQNRISIEGETMTMQHMKSGFQTVWKRAK